MKDIKDQAKASSEKKGSTITGSALKHSDHARIAMKRGGTVKDRCANGGKPSKGGCKK
jgi:hypothetical protein